MAALPERLSAALAALAGKSLMGFPVCGALLSALAAVDLGLGATASGVRLAALAERFHLVRQFLPTMSVSCIRQEAEQADKAAYVDAVSGYAALARDELPAAVLAALRDRPQV